MHISSWIPSSTTLARVLLAAALFLPARPLLAQCTYNGLSNRTTVTASSTPEYFDFSQAANFWSVVAVRPAAGPTEDWDITQYSSTAAFPTCVTGSQTSSTYGVGVTDFVIGDYNHDPLTQYYIGVNRFGGASNAEVEWDQTSGLLNVNGSFTVVNVGVSDLIHVYDVFLSSGVNYSFEFGTGGSAALKLLLFRNAAGGNLWTGRSSREFEVTSTTTYTAPSTGYYGVVVVNDNHSSGSYQLQVGTCMTPTALASGTATLTVQAENSFSFNQTNNFWSAVGVRRTTPGVDWDIEDDSGTAGPGYPNCLSGVLASSTGLADSVDFVVGDFNFNTPGTYYTRPHMFTTGGGGGAYVEWSGGAQALSVNAPLVTGNTGATDVLQIWDTYLVAGHQYTFTFMPTGAAATKILLFRNGGATTLWEGRAAREFSATGSTNYTAPTTGWYGVVVVNDDGGSGSYQVGVGECSNPIPLASNVVSGDAGVGFYSFNQADDFWTVVGVLAGTPGDDWDLQAWGTLGGSAFPTCQSSFLAGSGYTPPTTDFFVGDFNHNPVGTYYANAYLYQRLGNPNGRVLWDQTEGVVLVNGAAATHAGGPNDFVHVWDVLLSAGTQYTFTFNSIGPNNYLHLFRNAGGGTYWAGRASAEFSYNGGFQTYTAPTSGYYGIVVSDDDGGAGNYTFSVRTCTSPFALSKNTVVNTPLAENYYSFNQTDFYWTGVAARGTTDWDVYADGSVAAGPWPSCLGGALAGSADIPPRTDFVVGDFNHNPLGTYYSEAQEYSGNSTGTVEWASGANLLNPGDPAANHATGPTDVLATWDSYLAPGHPYTFVFSHAGGAALKLCIFKNTSGATYWAPRDQDQLELPATATWKTPGAPGGPSEFYGLMVVNDNGVSDNYSLQVLDAGTTDVDGTVPAATLLRGVQPNPARGGAQIQFALREGGPVRFQVLDMAGRLVVELPEREWSAGSWIATWDGLVASGGRARPGLYFVRMMSGDRTIGTSRFTLLE